MNISRFFAHLLPQRSRRQRFRLPHKLMLILELEELESRWVPSTFEASPPYVVLCHACNGTGDPGSGSPPLGLSPAQIRHAYGIDAVSFSSNGISVPGDGSGQTVAIVDAYDDPSMASDLAVFDQQFGLPAPPSFVKVGIDGSGQASTTNFPLPNAAWAGEAEIDVEAIHAVAPRASILLVEAKGADLDDLLNAIDYARKYPGVAAVAMSWGGNEFTGQGQYDSYFTTPTGHTGVTFFASVGDNGYGVAWPAISDHVVAVGGTTLQLDASGNYQSESGWSRSGGGVSTLVPQPCYQKNLVLAQGDPSADGMRVAPDVAFDANVTTGMAAYGIYGLGGWVQAGGTSVAAPMWAGLMAIVDQGRALDNLPALDGYTQMLPALYQLPSADFHDITTGNNGYPAGAGFDVVTGLGTPVANKLVADLCAPSAPQILTSILVRSPATTIGDGSQEQFSAIALDQFGLPMVPQPAITWSLVSGSNNLSSIGLYTAPSSGTGSDTVLAMVSESSIPPGSATVNYLPGPAIAWPGGNPVAGTTANLSASLSDPNAGTLNYSWSVLTEPAGAAPSFNPASGSAGPGTLNTTVTFNLAGHYVFQLSVTDGAGLSTSSCLSVTVKQILSLTATPVTGGQSTLSAQVSDANSPSLSYSWLVTNQPPDVTPPQVFPSNGTASNGTITASALFFGPGSYTFQLNVSDSLGTTISGTVVVVVQADPPTLSAINATPFPGLGGTFTLSDQAADSNPGALKYFWLVTRVPGGAPAPTLSSQYGYSFNGSLGNMATFHQAGTYALQLTVTDGWGLSASKSLPLTVNANPPTIKFSAPTKVTSTITTLSAR